ncbi:hypothetical protein [Magnetospirillum sp. 64-120]|uniref:hypothetical protein n=1 Tax=Magnetospirillum sp. 64-120 TaxID=1895778 RepID=UPI0025C07DED|nr:hypothetical protein [Magnetospirillum sp. 64-120]
MLSKAETMKIPPKAALGNSITPAPIKQAKARSPINSERHGNPWGAKVTALLLLMVDPPCDYFFHYCDTDAPVFPDLDSRFGEFPV